MNESAKSSRHRDLENVDRDRPLTLVAALHMAGHLIRGTTAPLSSGPGSLTEVVDHG